MRRVMYVFLPNWPIDRLRRHKTRRAVPTRLSAAGRLKRRSRSRRWSQTGGRRLLAAVNPAAAAAGLAPGMPLADALSFLPGLATAPAEPAADAGGADPAGRMVRPL